MHFLLRGAGQILVIFLIFNLKQESHKTRQLSICLLSISSIISFFCYAKTVRLDLNKCILLVIISVASGFIGSKIMLKIKSNILNLISGLTVVGLIVFKIFLKG